MTKLAAYQKWFREEALPKWNAQSNYDHICDEGRHDIVPKMDTQ